jgi:hypothetical protein
MSDELADAIKYLKSNKGDFNFLTCSDAGAEEFIKHVSGGILGALGAGVSGGGKHSKKARDVIPKPKDGKSITSDESKQRGLCIKIANLINAMGDDKIDTTQSPNDICRQVVDSVDNMSHGIKHQFDGANKSITSTLQSLHDLKTMIEKAHTKMYQEIVSSSDETLQANAASVNNIHNLLLSEINRQINILANLTHTKLKHADRELSEILSENTNLKTIFSSIRATPGTAEFGDKLSYWLSGVNNVAEMAHTVSKALKAIGMSAQDYKQIHHMNELDMKTQSIMEKFKREHLDEYTKEYIDKFTNAVNVLRKHQGRHDEISKLVKTGGYGAMYSNGYSDGGHDGGHDGDHSDGYSGGYVPLKTKLAKQNSTRIVMLKEFKRKAKIQMDMIYADIFELAKAVGAKKIKLTDDLYRFKVILNDMTLVFVEGIEYPLTGYYTHASAIEQKERFLGLLKALITASTSLKSSSPLFEKLNGNLTAVLRLVDFYSDKVAVFTSKTAMTKTSKGAAEDKHISGSGEFKATITLRNAKNTFNHFYNIAKFKSNLQVASQEMSVYNKDYNAVVGMAVARETDKCAEAYITLKKDLDDKKSEAATALDGLTKINNSAMDNDEYLKKDEWTKEAVLEVHKSFMDGKMKLYRVAQAIDIYLVKFTDGLAANPDDVREIAKLLQNIELISNWFNEKSGDSIAAMYEIFPWNMQGFRVYNNRGIQNAMFGGTDRLNRTQVSQINPHYYSIIGKSIVGNSTDKHPSSLPPQAPGGRKDIWENKEFEYSQLPGNPFMPLSPTRGALAHKFAKYTISKMYALKNIVNAFAYLESRQTDKDLAKEVFLTPTEIYSHLVDYMYISSLSMGWDKTNHVVAYGSGTELNKMQYKLTGKWSMSNHFCSSTITASGDKMWGPNAGNQPDDDKEKRGDFATKTAEFSNFRIAPYQSFQCIRAAEGEVEGRGLGLKDEATVKPSYGKLTDKNTTTLMLTKKLEILPKDITTNANETMDGKDAEKESIDILKMATNIRYNYSVVMSGITAHPDGAETESLSGWKSIFDNEDKIFINIIKAMAAKIFTVCGLYNMLNYADKQTYSLNPTRVILGGSRGGKKGRADSSSYQTPKIYPEAVELYARLPLLAEFYRDIFCFDDICEGESDDTSELLISMVPEVGSLWAGFVQCIFEQPKNTNGIYTENVSMRIIHEINEIYHLYKAKQPKEFVMSIIKDFVADINNRYGVINRGEIQSYQLEESDRRLVYQNRTDMDLDEMDTLHEDDTYGTGIAPSDMYSSINPVKMSSTHDINPGIYRALRVFRSRIDKRVQAITHNSKFLTDRDNIPDFSMLIMSTKETLKTISSPTEQFKMVVRMMTGMDVKSQQTKEAFLMFHETVVTPLATLASITDMLTRYEEMVSSWDAYTAFNVLKNEWDPKLASSKYVSLWLQSTRKKMDNKDINDYEQVVKILDEGNAATKVNEATGLTDAIVSERFKEMLKLAPDYKKINNSSTMDAIYNNLVRKVDSHKFAAICGFDKDVTLMDYIDGANILNVRHNGTNNEAYNVDAVNLFSAHEATSIGYNKDGKKDPDYGIHRRLAYLMINWEGLFKQMVSCLYGLTSELSGMCEVTTQNDKVIINHTKLQSTCEDVLSQVRKNMDKFRGVISSNILSNYETISISGSVNDIQNRLLDDLFGDKSGRGLKRAHLIVTNNFLLLANKLPSNTNLSVDYYSLSIPRGVKVDGMNDSIDIKSNLRPQGWSVENVLAELTHYSSRTMSSIDMSGSNYNTNVTPSGSKEPLINFGSINSVQSVALEHDPLLHLLQTLNNDGKSRTLNTKLYGTHRYNYYLQNHVDGTKDSGFRGDSTIEPDDLTADKSRISHTADGNTLNKNISNTDRRNDVGEGLMMKLNEVLASYLNTFWDTSTSKIYSPLIENMANGPANISVFKARGWPDFNNLISSSNNNVYQSILEIEDKKLSKVGKDYISKISESSSPTSGQPFMDLRASQTGVDSIGSAYSALSIFNPPNNDIEDGMLNPILNTVKVLSPYSSNVQLVDKLGDFTKKCMAGRQEFHTVIQGNLTKSWVVIMNASDVDELERKEQEFIAALKVTGYDYKAPTAPGGAGAWVDFEPIQYDGGVGGSKLQNISHIKINKAGLVANTFGTNATCENIYRSIRTNPGLKLLTMVGGGSSIDAVLNANDTVPACISAVGMGVTILKYLNRVKQFLLTEISSGIYTTYDEIAGNLLQNVEEYVKIILYPEMITNERKRIENLICLSGGNSNKLDDYSKLSSYNTRVATLLKMLNSSGEANSIISKNTQGCVTFILIQLFRFINKFKSLLDDSKTQDQINKKPIFCATYIINCLMNVGYAENPFIKADGFIYNAMKSFINTEELGIGNKAEADTTRFNTYNNNVRKHLSISGVGTLSEIQELYLDTVKNSEKSNIVKQKTVAADAIKATQASAGVKAVKDTDAIGDFFRKSNDDKTLNDRVKLFNLLCEKNFDTAQYGKRDNNEKIWLNKDFGKAKIPTELNFTDTYKTNKCPSFLNGVGFLQVSHLIGIPMSFYGVQPESQAGTTESYNRYQYSFTGTSTILNLADVYKYTSDTSDASAADAAVSATTIRAVADAGGILYRLIRTSTEDGSDTNAGMNYYLKMLFNIFSKVVYVDDIKPTNNITVKGGYKEIGDPIEVVFASLAKCLRTALTETKNNIQLNSINSLAEVPIRMKESFKADLPIFSNLFQLITKKGELLKMLIKTGIGVDRTDAKNSGAILERPGAHGPVLQHLPYDQQASQIFHNGLLDKIISIANSIVASSTTIINDLNDAPLFLETHENSISEYKNTNSTIPYMPLSSLTITLKPCRRLNQKATFDVLYGERNTPTPVTYRDANLGLVVDSVGSDNFSFNYGSRLLLHDFKIKPMLEHMPGMMEIMKIYNLTSVGDKQMEQGSFSTFMGKNVELLRYASSAKAYSSLFGADRRIVDSNYFYLSDKTKLSESQIKLQFPTLQMISGLSTVISLTTSSDKTSRTGEVVDHVINDSNNKNMPINRQSSMIYNILDLNISPINVHAMRKEIPLATLYNYAYTFDSFISDLVGSSRSEYKDLLDNDQLNTHDVLALLCKHPYAPISRVNYYTKLSAIINGNTSIDLYGYPKFISDQLWNKALLNEMGVSGDAKALQRSAITKRGDARFNKRTFKNNTDWGNAIGRDPSVAANTSSDISNLHYLAHTTDGDTELVEVLVSPKIKVGKFGTSNKGILAELGRLRFDTKLARNLMFIANVQRIISHKLENELTKTHFSVVSSAAATNQRIMNYHDMETVADINID